MSKKTVTILDKLLIFSICVGSMVSSAWADQQSYSSTLAPKINLDSKTLQKVSQDLTNQSDLINNQEELPDWLNWEGLDNLKKLRIKRSISRNKVSTIDSDEGDELFDVIDYKFAYEDDNGNDFEAGKISIWKYHRPEGVRLFLHKSQRFNIRVVIFKPNLPRGKSRKSMGNHIETAGLGISMLWLLFAQEQNWQGQKALIFNAEVPSQKVFRNLTRRWDNLIFTGTPFYAKELKLAPLVHVGFVIPNLTSAQMNYVKDFFEHKVEFLNEDQQQIVVPAFIVDKFSEPLIAVHIQQAI